MRTSFLNILIYIFPLFAIGQIVIWEENFDSYPNGTITGTGSGASSAQWNSEAGASVNGGLIFANDTDNFGSTTANPLEWVTDPITISPFMNIAIAITTDTFDQIEFEDPDNYTVSYRIDGGAWIDIFSRSGSTTQPIDATYSVTGLSGATLELRAQFHNTFTNETYTLDNVLITGNLFGDTDGDGILDFVDLDDDNDGILDDEECGSLFCLEPILNEDFESPFVPDGGFRLLDESLVSGWNTTATDDLIEIWGTGHSGITSFSGRQHAELNATQNSALFQILCLSPGTQISWSVEHRGRTTGTPDVAVVRIGGSFAGATVQTTMSNDRSSWNTHTNTYTVPAGEFETFFIFEAVSTASGSLSIGNLIDNVQINILSTPTCPDIDNDGTTNSFDLDTDNDGIYDLVESGNINFDTNNDGIIDASNGSVGNNGVYDFLETFPDSGIISPAFLPMDTDGDGDLDLMDTDSDGDGCSDSNEAYDDALADGGDNELFGIGDPPPTEPDGTVSAASYQTPADLDSNSIFQFQEAPPIAISTQPTDVITSLGCDLNFSIVSDAGTFQWQRLIAGTWTNLTDNTLYSGTNTNQLAISRPSVNENNSQYRVIITSNTSTVCGTFTTLISNVAGLTLRVNTVISNRRITYRISKN